MGACLSALGGVPGMPSIDFPAADVATETAKFVTRVPDEIDNAEKQLKTDWEAAKGRGEDYKVMGGKGNKTELMVLKKDADEKAVDADIQKAAKMKVAKGEFAQSAASEVWKAIEPKIDEQKPSDLPSTPVMSGDQLWAKAKEKVQDKVEAEVSAKIEAACDEALKKKQAS